MKAIYAGSFDPVTRGHMYIIKSAARIFDELHVAIAKNPAKKYSISLPMRAKLIIKSMEEYECDNCTLGIIENELLVNYAQEQDCEIIVRGIRNNTDFTYEQGMKNVNDDISHRHVNTVYFIPPRELCEVSSSLVKGIVGNMEWERVLNNYIPNAVLEYYKRIIDEE